MCSRREKGEEADVVVVLLVLLALTPIPPPLTMPRMWGWSVRSMVECSAAKVAVAGVERRRWRRASAAVVGSFSPLPPKAATVVQAAWRRNSKMAGPVERVGERRPPPPSPPPPLAGEGVEDAEKSAAPYALVRFNEMEAESLPEVVVGMR